MSTILDRIINHKKKEVERNKSLYPVKLLEQSIYFDTKPISLRHYLTRPDKLGIIAEFKRRSPSKGVINAYADVERTTIGYMQAGASAISMLTDKDYFGGSNSDLTTARKFNYCPLLRKDFIVNEYQILEAKSIGADAILLIASALEPAAAARYAIFAKSLGLEVLLECVSKIELDSYYTEDMDVVGINNRNLKDFTQSLDLSFELIDKMASHAVKVAESSIRTAHDIAKLKQAGFNGFLIGEAFMKTARPEKTCEALISETLRILNKAGVEVE